MQGRPLPGTELTDAVNPLEAGLYHAVSLSKGCYMGQETLAKVHTKDAVKQQLWGLRLSQPGQLGADVTLGVFVGAPGHPPSASPSGALSGLPNHVQCKYSVPDAGVLCIICHLMTTRWALAPAPAPWQSSLSHT